MSCCDSNLTTYRNSDLRVVYQFPRGTNLAGVLPAFFFRASAGAFPLLSVGSTPTVNGSVAVASGNTITLTISYLDLQVFADQEVYEGVYDSVLAGDGLVSRFVGGQHTQFIDGSLSDCCSSSGVEVSLDGECVQVLVEGGNISLIVSEYIATLESLIASLTQTNLALEYTGNGVQTNFNLAQSVPAAKAGALRVWVAGVLQYAGVGAANPDYTTSGTTLMFTSAPDNGALIRIVHSGIG